MIDKQKIQEAANNYIGHEPEIDEGCNVSARREAFKDGVDWFKKNIWHSCQEEPEKGEFIVTEFFDVGKCYEIDSVSWTEDWEEIDGKHYCPDCYEVEVVNGIYNVKAKQL